MPLPRPYELSARIVELIAKGANCPISYEQHSGPLTLPEFLAIRKSISTYLTEIANANLAEVRK